MSRRFDLKHMTPKQKQAALVLAGCALALIVTISVVAVKLSGAGGGHTTSSGEEYDQNAYQIDQEAGAILAETEDGGTQYLADTLFVGDSNTVRMYNYGLLTLDQFVGKEGVGIGSLTTEQCVAFKNDSKTYAIPQAIARMKPRRIVVMMGTNNANGSMSAEEFSSEYADAMKAIEESYPYCDILIAAVPPIPEDHSKYPDLKMQPIDAFNQALVKLCEDKGYHFLNTSEVLKDETGFGKAEYFESSDIHMNADGLSAILSYVRTHVYESEDRRPDTNDIPQRASSASSGSSSSSSAVTYTAKYDVESAQQGSLSSGNKSYQSSLTFEITDPKESITVTAQPAVGYKFVKWSDGVTTATRTDSNFTQNFSVRAQFAVDLSIQISPSSLTMKEGEDQYLVASVVGGDQDNVKWTGAAEKTGDTYSLRSLTVGTWNITASITVGDQTKTATVTVVVEPAPTETPTPTPTNTPSPTPVPATPTPTPVPATPTPTPQPTATPAPTATPEPTQPDGEGGT